MIYLTVVLLIIASFFLGYHFQVLKKKVTTLEDNVKQKIDKPKVSDLPQSILVDELDEVQVAMYEHEKLMKRLNPDD